MFQNSRNLVEFVNDTNRWRAMFNQPALTLDTSAGRQAVADKINGELSPENLTCDGELPRSQVQARYRMLMNVAKELKQLDPSVKMYEFA